MPDIIFKNVCKSFGGQMVVNGFSATIPAGQLSCLMGASGSGKTTIAKMLMLLQKPDTGTITGNAGLRFSAVFQEDRLIEHLNATQNVALVQKKPPSGSIKAALGLAGLAEEDMAKPVARLSGGQRRRVALVRALQAPADVVVLDEPFKGLDKASLQRCLALVASWQNGRSFLLITHSRQQAAMCSNTITI